MLNWIKENKTDAFGIFFLFILPILVFMINDLLGGWEWGMDALLLLMKVFSLPFCLVVPIMFCNMVYKTITSRREARLLGEELSQDPSRVLLILFMGAIAFVSLYCFLYLLSEEIFDWDWFDRFSRLRILSGMWD